MKQFSEGLVGIVFIVVFLFSLSNAYAKNFLLREFVPATSVKLHSIKDEFTLSIPIPYRWKVKEATLRFSYINSSALLAYKSKLVVSVDNIPLKQVTLDPVNYENSVTVKIPGRLLSAGYHDLTFTVSQHSEKECEDPFAPELWTVLKLGEASFVVDYIEQSIPLKLSSIPKYIEDPKTFPNVKLNIVLPVLDKEFLRLASIVAGGIGARLEYRALSISTSPKLKPGVDNIFIGTKDMLKSIDKEWKLPTGAVLGINHLPGIEEKNTGSITKRDSRYSLIAITGDSIKEIERVALAFSSISYPFPDTQFAIINNVIMPSYKPFEKKDVLIPGLPVKFKDLGFSTYVFKGLKGQPVSVDFYLPSDLYIKPNEYAVLSLHFAFSGAIRKDSTVKIELNGKPVSSIHLDNEHGAMYENYKILIPTYMFKPGKNTISFKAVLLPLIIRRCEGFHDMNLFLTLFDDSIIRFPEMSHWGKLPAIEYFFDSGFPFSKMADASNFSVVLTEKDYLTSSFVLNLFAYLGQITGVIPVKADISFDIDESKKQDMILVGRLASLPSSLMEKAPLKLLTPNAIVKYPQIEDLTNVQNRTWCERVEEKLRGYAKLFPISAKTENAVIEESEVSIDNDTGLIMEFESPYQKGSTIMVWTLKDNNGFLQMVDALWSGKLRSSAKGDLVLFSFSNIKDIYSLKLGPSYYTGELKKTDKIDFFLRSYTWLFYSILAICVIGLAIIFAAYLRRRKKKRLSNER